MNENPNVIRHLTQRELAERWNKSESTLERYRSDHVGPNYLKIGGKILYRLVDIEQYEHECLYHGPDTRVHQDLSGVTA